MGIGNTTPSALASSLEEDEVSSVVEQESMRDQANERYTYSFRAVDLYRERNRILSLRQ